MNVDIKLKQIWQVQGESYLAYIIGTAGPVTAYIYASTFHFGLYAGGGVGGGGGLARKQ